MHQCARGATRNETAEALVDLSYVSCCSRSCQPPDAREIRFSLLFVMEQKPPFPPFSEETAKQKIQMAEDAWNSRDPIKVSLAYTVDSEWRNRDQFINGREQIVAFLQDKWKKEQGYRLKKTYWAHGENRIAVRFEYEYHDKDGQWWRAYGNENWEFDENGLMRKRFANINDVAISEGERKFV